MYQKDYILRMIEMFGKMIAGILGLIKKGEFARASADLGNIYYDMLKEDSSFFRNIPEEELTNKLLNEHNYTNGHLEILAGLFDADSLLQMAQGNLSESLDYSRKALRLFEFIDNEYKTYSGERLKKIAEIRSRIEVLLKDDRKRFI